MKNWIETNRKLIKDSGISVWLDVTPERLIARGNVGGGKERPLFRGPDDARRLLEARRSIYALADERLELEGETEDADTEQLFALLSDRIEIS